MSSFIDEVNATGVLAVAAAFDLHVRGRAVGPCPACGAEQRGSSDRRPPLRSFHEGGRTLWKCFPCGAAGDAVALAAIAATGEPLSKANWREVRAACAWRGLCAPEPGDAVGRIEDRRARPVRPVPVLDPPRRPPVHEIEQLARQVRPVTTDEEAVAWLRGRALEPDRVEELRLAAVLPTDARLPSWARLGKHGPFWIETGHRLILGAVSAHGRVESVRARCLREHKVKVLAPTDYSSSGLVLADALGRALLGRRALGDGSDPVVRVREVGLVVQEGEPDFLTRATAAGDSHDAAPAVLGLIAGSWSDEIAVRIPDGTRVIVRTHRDETGERYAARVIETLAGRCELRRWTSEAHS